MIDDTSPQFDVFLCHNSEDKEAVIEIAHKLESHNIRPWLDDWELQPGYPWQPELEKQIKNIKAAAVFVGKSGIGPWQEDEIHGFLRQFKQRKCPVIPVLLLDAPQRPQLPIFLEGITWVDFRQKTLVYTDPWQKLIWGITGRKPERRPKQNQVIQTDFIQADDLSSEKRIDYTQLRDLLAAGKWKEADEETLAVMLKASGREKEGWLNVESINNFPCTDLRTIDQLWVKYSEGRFGFSVQKRIWESVGGSPDADYETYCKFGDRVGWRVKGKWIDYPDDVDDVSTSAPEGHLPFRFRFRLWVVRVLVGWGVGGGWGVWIFSRAETCKV